MKPIKLATTRYALDKAKPTHTPTPWRETEGSRDSEFNYIVGHKTQVICEIDISHPEQRANTAFIVRAVNLHSELIHFVKEVKRVADDGMLTPEWVKLANKLIAQAEQI